MAKIKIHKYQMDPDGKFHLATTALMGLSFFLRAAYYFGFTRPENAGGFELLMLLILPMLLEIGFMVMIRGLKLNLPGIYGIMGATFCAILLIQSFCVGGVLRIILAILAYMICGAALVGVGWGLLSKSLGVTVLGLTFAIRLLAFDLKYLLGLRLVVFMREVAGLCAILALAFLCAGFFEKDKPAQNKVAPAMNKPVKKAPPKRKRKKKPFVLPFIGKKPAARSGGNRKPVKKSGIAKKPAARSGAVRKPANRTRGVIDFDDE